MNDDLRFAIWAFALLGVCTVGRFCIFQTSFVRYSKITNFELCHLLILHMTHDAYQRRFTSLDCDFTVTHSTNRQPTTVSHPHPWKLARVSHCTATIRSLTHSLTHSLTRVSITHSRVNHSQQSRWIRCWWEGGWSDQ